MVQFLLLRRPFPMQSEQKNTFPFFLSFFLAVFIEYVR